MNTLISKGKFQFTFVIPFCLLAGILVALSWNLFKTALSPEYTQIPSLMAAIIFSSLFAYFLFKGIAAFKAVDVYEDYLKVKWLYGLLYIKLKPADITQYGEASIKKAKYLYLRKGTTDLLLSTASINNDIELIEQLRSWQVKRKDNVSISEFSKVEDRIANITMMVLGALLCILVFRSTYNNSPDTMDSSLLMPLQGELSRLPDIDRPTGKSPSCGVDFSLSEYPAIHFLVGASGYKTMNIDDVANYPPGTKARFWIEREQYEKKITKTSTTDFSDKHFEWQTIMVYAAELDGHNVLDLDKRNEEAAALTASNRRWGWVIIAIVAFVFFSPRLRVRK